MDYLLVNIFAVLLVIAILWWFLLSKPLALPLSVFRQTQDILVKEGVYQPANIRVAAHKPIVLRFLRLDPAPCAEVVIFPHFNRSYMLPLNKPVEITLDPQPVSEVEFTCQMGMYRGRLMVE